MKKIHLHTASADNLGHFQAAGTTLTVSDRQLEGHIDEPRARALVASHGAIVEREAAAPKTASAPRKGATRKAPARAAAPPPATSLAGQKTSAAAPPKADETH